MNFWAGLSQQLGNEKNRSQVDLGNSPFSLRLHRLESLCHLSFHALQLGQRPMNDYSEKFLVAPVYYRCGWHRLKTCATNGGGRDPRPTEAPQPLAFWR